MRKGKVMSKNEYKIPEKYREAVEPILVEKETIISAFQESFTFSSKDSIFPKWSVLTNLKLIFLVRETPGISVHEYYLQGMTIELFQDHMGMYNTITFLLNDKAVYMLQVKKDRWPEAVSFAHEVQKSISQIEHELRTEENGGGDGADSTADTQQKEKEKTKCTNDKRHLKDLANMGVITKEEYEEDVEKTCEE